MNEIPEKRFANLDLASDIKAAENVENVMPDAVRAAEKVMTEQHTDKKTGLMDEDLWRRSLQNEIEKAQPEDRIRVWVADLDQFKAVNDELGHDAGDELLGIVGQAFQTTFKRDMDVIGHGSRESGSKEDIARLGGDEFAVLTVTKAADDSSQNARTNDLENETNIQTERVNQNLKDLLTGTRFEKFGLKLSIGGAELQPGDKLYDIFARADIKMFEAKYTGKIERLSDEDIIQLQKIIPYLESKGARVEQWLKKAVQLRAAA